jgi:hypothetical protein
MLSTAREVLAAPVALTSTQGIDSWTGAPSLPGASRSGGLVDAVAGILDGTDQAHLRQSNQAAPIGWFILLVLVSAIPLTVGWHSRLAAVW